MQLNQPAVGFMRAPVVTDPARIEADVAVVGVPFGWPYPRADSTAGCIEAPAAVRRRTERLADFRGHWDFDLDGPMLPADAPPRLVDAGNVPGHPGDGPGNSVATTEAVSAVLERGSVPVCIGGDDSVVIPILRAFAGHGPVTVLQIDAHLDFRDEVRGVREGYSSPMRRASEMEHVSGIVHAGLRGVGSARRTDVDEAREAGNVLVTAAEIHERGVGSVLERLASDASVFVAFDCDGLDPSVFPAVSAPSPGGLTYAEASDLLGGVGSRLAGVAFTEYVPALDASGLCALVAVRLMIRVIGGLG